MNGVDIREKQTIRVTKDWVIAIAGGIRYLGRPVEVQRPADVAKPIGDGANDTAPELILSPIYEIGRTQNNQGAIGAVVFPAELCTSEGFRGLLLHADVVFCLESAHERDIRLWQELVDNAEKYRLEKILAIARLSSPRVERVVKVEDKA